jgi:hypothetical protein
MPEYTCWISDGSSGNGGGETTLSARDLDHAEELAREWADGGDYPEGGCRLRMRVFAAADPRESRSFGHTIEAGDASEAGEGD